MPKVARFSNALIQDGLLSNLKLLELRVFLAMLAEYSDARSKCDQYTISAGKLKELFGYSDNNHKIVPQIKSILKKVRGKMQYYDFDGFNYFLNDTIEKKPRVTINGELFYRFDDDFERDYLRNLTERGRFTVIDPDILRFFDDVFSARLYILLKSYRLSGKREFAPDDLLPILYGRDENGNSANNPAIKKLTEHLKRSIEKINDTDLRIHLGKKCGEHGRILKYIFEIEEVTMNSDKASQTETARGKAIREGKQAKAIQAEMEGANDKELAIISCDPGIKDREALNDIICLILDIRNGVSESNAREEIYRNRLEYRRDDCKALQKALKTLRRAM